MDRREALAHNEAHFDRDVEKGASSATPWLDLDRDVVRRFVRGELDAAPGVLRSRCHLAGIDLGRVEGTDVLCMGSGGGQQSAILGLLGARVTVFELSQRQLDGDRAAAAHYGYEVAAIHGDMQDPSSLRDESFDAVFTPCTMYVPDIGRLLAECVRIMRTGAVLSMGLLQPSQQCRFLAGLVADDVYDPVSRHAIEYIHYMDEIFNGLVDAGLRLTKVHDEGRSPEFGGPVGSLDPLYVDHGGYFVITATKPERH